MLLGGVLIGVDEGEHLVQVDVQQLSDLVHQVQVINWVDGNMVSSIVPDPAACMEISEN